MKWTPISLEDIYNKINNSESELTGDLWNFWKLTQIYPEKWNEEDYGKLGGGFWAVGICGRKVIWYNDIEEGFNISDYKTYGRIEGYYCNHDELSWAFTRLFNIVKYSGDIIGQAGPPQNLG
jgi:hypothetical protein